MDTLRSGPTPYGSCSVAESIALPVTVLPKTGNVPSAAGTIGNCNRFSVSRNWLRVEPEGSGARSGHRLRGRHGGIDWDLAPHRAARGRHHGIDWDRLPARERVGSARVATGTACPSRGRADGTTRLATATRPPSHRASRTPTLAGLAHVPLQRTGRVLASAGGVCAVRYRVGRRLTPTRIACASRRWAGRTARPAGAGIGVAERVRRDFTSGASGSPHAWAGSVGVVSPGAPGPPRVR